MKKYKIIAPHGDNENEINFFFSENSTILVVFLKERNIFLTNCYLNRPMW